MRDFEFYYTKDGSIGLYSYADNDVYHSKFGALSEAWEKFVLPSGISKTLNTKETINVLDLCYGIGYNTKSLMSYVINSNEKFLKKEKFLNKIKNFFKNKNKKNKPELNNNVSIDTNNPSKEDRELLTPIESIYNDNVSHINIDCLDINKSLIKISPLLKTVITPQEIFSNIIPNCFKCFDSYWKIKKFLMKTTLRFSPKNSQKISELLDLKFNNSYDEIDNEYRIHKFVNYILIDNLISMYKTNYVDKEVKKLLTDKTLKRYFDKSLIKYAKFKQDFRYKLLSKLNLLGYLHNIYYDHLSKRYKDKKFDAANSLFSIRFYPDDARKSILTIEKQYDYIFLDAFTFSKAPELWSIEFIAELYRRLSPTGILITYSNSALVRNTFLENKFYVGKIIDKKTNRCIGTIAAKEKSLIENPLSNFELGLCSTKAGIPYRDPALSRSKEDILKYREYDFKTSELMTSSKFIKIRTDKNSEEDVYEDKE